MHRLLFILLLPVILFGCQEKPLPKVAPVIDKPQPSFLSLSQQLDKIQPKIDSLLIQYYYAGWMDAQNSCVDLANNDAFTNERIEAARKAAWRKIRLTIALKESK